MDTKISVRVLGGAASDNFTGFCIELTVKQAKHTFRCLVDAGLIQCQHKIFFHRNREILDYLQPEKLDAVVLTHPHIDHIGRLPLLVNNGFGDNGGRIYCTEATASLLSIMLQDSAKIQAVEAVNLKNRLMKAKEKFPRKSSDNLTLGNYDRVKWHYKSFTKDDSRPLYNLEDVDSTCALVKNGGCLYHAWIRLSKAVDVKFYPSGHVMGGAIAVFRISTRKKDVYIGFSGDLGRRDGIILPPPEMVLEPVDYWFTESTYGGKVHPERDQEIERLLDVVRLAYEKKSRIIIPSFTLERTQEIVYLLSYFMSQEKIPCLPIYLDSPMASKITDAFASRWKTKMFQGQEALTFNPFDAETNPFFRAINSPEATRDLIADQSAYIVIAGSGMCDAGRVRDYLKAGLGRENTIVCLIGYMAENSLGRKLKDHLPIVNMNGNEIVIRAKIEAFDSFSAHADGPFLADYARQIASSGNLKKIFIVHGETDSAAYLKLELLSALPAGRDWLKDVVVPKLNHEIAL